MAPEKQETFTAYMGQALNIRGNVTSDFLKDIFNGSYKSNTRLGDMMFETGYEVEHRFVKLIVVVETLAEKLDAFDQRTVFIILQSEAICHSEDFECFQVTKLGCSVDQVWSLQSCAFVVIVPFVQQQLEDPMAVVDDGSGERRFSCCRRDIDGSPSF